MLDVQVSIPGIERFQAALKDLEKGVFFRPAMESLLAQAGERVKDRAKQLAPKAFGTLAQSIDYRVQGDRVTVGVLRDRRNPGSSTGTQEYGYYQEYGTSGHAPPPMALVPWMQKVGYTGSAYLLSQTIKRRGLRPQPFLGPALEQSTAGIAQIARIEYQKALDAFANRAGGGLLGRIGAFFRGFFG